MSRRACHLLLLVLAPAISGWAQILSQADFESGDFGPLRSQRAHPDSLTVVPAPAQNGGHALRTLLRDTDPKVANGQRAELYDKTPAQLGVTYWYAVSIYAGEEFAMPAKKDGILFQFHQQAKSLSPVLAFRAANGRWRITTDAAGQRRVIGEVPFEQGRWTHWVVRVKWTNDATGEWTFWKDGVQVAHEEKVLTTYAAETMGPYPKFGQYHTVDESPRNIVYFDNYRFAGPESSYDDVAQRGQGHPG